MTVNKTEMWKEAVAAYYTTGIFGRELRKTMKIISIIIGVPAELRTKYTFRIQMRSVTD
jgi:hypothetical protein